MYSFLETDTFNGIATLFTALVAIGLYYWEQNKKKRDTAKIIIQEIRRAEDIISEYKEQRQYKFTKKIIATNSWAKSIHYFVGDLAQDELDKISTLYSTGEYLDLIISKISDYKFDRSVIQCGQQEDTMLSGIPNFGVNIPSPLTSQSGPLSGAQPAVGQVIGLPIQVKISLPTPGKEILDEISVNYQPIYHSSICEKLKRIAKIK